MNKLWVLVGMGMGIVIGIAIVGLKLTHAPALAVPGQDGRAGQAPDVALSGPDMYPAMPPPPTVHNRVSVAPVLATGALQASDPASGATGTKGIIKLGNYIDERNPSGVPATGHIKSDGPTMRLECTINQEKFTDDGDIVIYARPESTAVPESQWPTSSPVKKDATFFLQFIQSGKYTIFGKLVGKTEIIDSLPLTISSLTDLEPSVITKLVESISISGQTNQAKYAVDSFVKPVQMLGRQAKVTVAVKLPTDQADKPDLTLSISNQKTKKELQKGSAPLTVTQDLDAEFEGGENHLVATVRRGWTGRESQPVIVRVSEPPNPPTPIITHYYSGTHASPTALPSQQTEIKIYNSYLRLTGLNAPANHQLRFLIFTIDGENLLLRKELIHELKVDAQGGWDVSLEGIPKLANGPMILFALAEAGTAHSYSKPLLMKFTALSPLNSPKVENVQLGSGSAEKYKSTPYTTNQGAITVDGDGLGTDTQVVAFLDGSDKPIGKTAEVTSGTKWKLTIPNLPEGEHYLTFALAQNGMVGGVSDPVRLSIRTRGPRVIGVQPPNFGTAPGIQALTIQFDPANQLSPGAAGEKDHYSLVPSGGTGRFDRGVEVPLAPSSAEFDTTRNQVLLKFAGLGPDIYQLVVRGTEFTTTNGTRRSGIIDQHGNNLEGVEGKPKTDYKIVLGKPAACEEEKPPSETPGITGQTGPYVTFPTYTNPNLSKFPNGFNPGDHVETRVARLYYFRDAHRVAQIIARDVAKSYNRQAVDVRRRLADKSRDVANRLTDERRANERASVTASEKARQAERELQQEQAAQVRARRDATTVQQDVTRKQNEIDALPATDPKKKAMENELKPILETQKALNAFIDAGPDRIKAATTSLQTARDKEVQTNEAVQAKGAEENRAKEEQFRLEVAAAHEDPDTYAPGDPNSEDPVRQVSVSVIGEGVIQLRGPIRGVNKIRTMINQIDGPVGQVKVAVHTVQINGEHGDRMEKVAGRIQRYIDHSRFLTSQTGQMLRRAVVQVAARKAEEAAHLCASEGQGQAARDRRYLYEFFGKDFTDELYALDSEFLHTGNKLLSLHSMDTTSLASALFMLALAKNTTRIEILHEFNRLLVQQLPFAEQNYFTASAPDKDCKNFQFFSQNAQFQSFLGFFNTEITGADTLNSIQREFIRLAQIFKSRLVTEMELNQRVMERAVIEERLGNYIQELEAQKRREAAANAVSAAFQKSVTEKRAFVSRTFAAANVRTRQVLDENVNLVTSLQRYLEDFGKAFSPQIQGIISTALPAVAPIPLPPEEEIFPGFNATPPLEKLRIVRELTMDRLDAANSLAPNSETDRLLARELTNNLKILENHKWKLSLGDQCVTVLFKDGIPQLANASDLRIWNTWFSQLATDAERLDVFKFGVSDQKALDDAISSLEKMVLASTILPTDADRLAISINKNLAAVGLAIHKYGMHFESQLGKLVARLSRENANLDEIAVEWNDTRSMILLYLKTTKPLYAEARNLFTAIDGVLEDLQKLKIQDDLARKEAFEARRPLDHKKLLDMLIDEVEDKYIELLEGTRAHTANIDNYIKQIATALDDDFNTQFYHPAFREVRKASRFWDVNLGQIETTSILTNNRAFAKVVPEAMMEFDLPKRDILIDEAMGASKALVDTYGALLQDPTFLSLTKLNSGQPTSSPATGASGGVSMVRNVIPGLPSQADERVLSQGGPGGNQFATPLDALIPDPAVYKFETGTGYEIRPVISPDGQSVVFHFNYMYTTNVREPVRGDEKHLGRIKRHFVDTDVQLGNYELREVSKYLVALKASRTSRGVPLLEDIPGLGVLFRPLPSAESSLQENIILAQATVFPTLFDLMGLRWAPAVSDLDPLGTSNEEFVVRGRKRDLMNHVFDFSTSQVDQFLRIPPAERRTDLYRTQQSIPYVHPNGYRGPGLNLRDSHLREGYDPRQAQPESQFVPRRSKDGAREREENEGGMPMMPGGPGQGGMPMMPGGPGQGGMPMMPGGPGQGGMPMMPTGPGQGGMPMMPGAPGQGGMPMMPGAPGLMPPNGQVIPNLIPNDGVPSLPGSNPYGDQGFQQNQGPANGAMPNRSGAAARTRGVIHPAQPRSMPPANSAQGGTGTRGSMPMPGTPTGPAMQMQSNAWPSDPNVTAPVLPLPAVSNGNPPFGPRSSPVSQDMNVPPAAALSVPPESNRPPAPVWNSSQNRTAPPKITSSDGRNSQPARGTISGTPNGTNWRAANPSQPPSPAKTGPVLEPAPTAPPKS